MEPGSTLLEEVKKMLVM